METRLTLRSQPIRAFHTPFDPDSTPIGVGTCTSATVSGKNNLFIGKLIPVQHMRLKGIGGKLQIEAKGTLQLTLLCPQQWAKQGPINKKGAHVRACHVSGQHTTFHFPGGIA